MPYATAANMIARYDVRLLGDLCSDADTRIASGSLATNDRMIAVLLDGAKEIDEALRESNRYTDTQLAAIALAGDSSLIRINCDLAMEQLYSARGQGVPPSVQAKIDKAYDRLQRLREGTAVLDVTAAINAGLPDLAQPTAAQRVILNSVTAIPIFPHPATQIVPTVVTVQ